MLLTATCCIERPTLLDREGMPLELLNSGCSVAALAACGSRRVQLKRSPAEAGTGLAVGGLLAAAAAWPLREEHLSAAQTLRKQTPAVFGSMALQVPTCGPKSGWSHSRWPQEAANVQYLVPAGSRKNSQKGGPPLLLRCFSSFGNHKRGNRGQTRTAHGDERDRVGRGCRLPRGRLGQVHAVAREGAG